MSLLYLGSIFFLVAFMFFAIFDGFYLHLWKFELFKRSESTLEHKIHTIRAVFFPVIIYFLYISETKIGFYLGVLFFLLDLLVLVLDAYVEDNSRQFMNGLPKWEYILHLFANSFHFTSILFMIATKIEVCDSSIVYSTSYMNHELFYLVKIVGQTVVPGSVVLAFVHLFLLSDFGKRQWTNYRLKIRCC